VIIAEFLRSQPSIHGDDHEFSTGTADPSRLATPRNHQTR